MQKSGTDDTLSLSVARLRALDFFVPPMIETLFWRPRFVTDSALMRQVVLLYWLVGATRPTRSSVLGAGDGVAHFALCQAIDKLNISGRCFGIGFWENGLSKQAPAALLNHATQFYEDISELRAYETSLAGLGDIRPESLDLLVVDLLDLPSDEILLIEEWMRRLRPQGTLVLHGTHGHFDAESSIGLLVATLEGRPRIEFDAGNGLTILPRGDTPAPRLQALLDICPDGVMPSEIDLFFRRLGQGVDAHARNILQVSKTEELLRSLTALQEQQAKTNNALDETTKAYEARSRKISDLQAAVFDRDTLLSELRKHQDTHEILVQATLDATRAEQEALQEQLALRNVESIKHGKVAAAQQTILQAALEVARSERENLTRKMEVQRDTHYRETAILTKLLEKTKADGASVLQKTLAAHKVAQAGLQKSLTKAQREVEVLHTSTSWRITEPLRKIKRLLTRR